MENMTIVPPALQLLEFLEAVRGLRGQPVWDIAECQDPRWLAADRLGPPPCALISTGDVSWLTVSNPQIPPPPPVPKDVVAQLRTGITDPERESAFAADFDDQHAELKTSATYTVAKAVSDWVAETLDKLADETVRSDVDLLKPVTMLVANIL